MNQNICLINCLDHTVCHSYVAPFNIPKVRETECFYVASIVVETAVIGFFPLSIYGISKLNSHITLVIVIEWHHTRMM